MSIKANQIQLHDMDENGNIQSKLYPVNRKKDVKVGTFEASEKLQLPGSEENETLDQTLASVKKYLSNMRFIASETREVSDDTETESSVNIASSKAVADVRAMAAKVASDLALDEIEISKKAPIDHSVVDKTYGSATSEKYGHVKLTDDYEEESPEGGSADDGLAASQKALVNAYKALNNAKAAINHASTTTDYGIGTDTEYGHVKLSDVFKVPLEEGAGVGASQKAVSEAFRSLNGDIKEGENKIYSKAPTHHASEETTYGVGSESEFGHVKVTDSYKEENSETGAAVNAVAPSAWALYSAYTELMAIINTKLPETHKDEHATTEKSSHVLLTDNYKESAGSADEGVSISSKGMSDAYAELSTEDKSLSDRITVLNNEVTPIASETIFNEDGSITVNTDDSEKLTVFNNDGSITETLKVYADSTKTKLLNTIITTTTFNKDNIKKTVTQIPADNTEVVYTFESEESVQPSVNPIAP